METLLFILFVVAGMAGAALAKKLTIIAALTGGLLAALIYMGTSWTGLAFLAAFFLLGTMATSWGKRYMQRLGLVQNETGRRNTGQVLANGGMGGLLGACAIIFPQHTHLFLLMMAAAFSSATADTVSSELGSICGKKFYDILTFRKGARGADGVISREGTLAGVVGSTIIALLYVMTAGWNVFFFWIILCGTIGNLADSLLGATLERRGVLGNDAVNFLNTAIAALAAYCFDLL